MVHFIDGIETGIRANQRFCGLAGSL